MGIYFYMANTLKENRKNEKASKESKGYCPYSDRDWYTDRECTILWDKEYKLPENREVLNLYSKTN